MCSTLPLPSSLPQLLLQVIRSISFPSVILLTEVGLILASLDLHTTGACLNQEVPDKLFQGVTLVAMVIDIGWRGSYFEGKPISTLEGVTVSNQERARLFILQHCNGCEKREEIR